ncbi:hypothetical protein CHS0354_014279 [Potamilus streckersoni]|uniref:Fibronectin type-III domain-containing protein n=1 Tax=Potamilus streckersoni TaxID=2493646 RepID=A0AAE0SL63_9BIVA|nr:hypothetical protein CHS0354_014279 [Potamilus streckersoni]
MLECNPIDSLNKHKETEQAVQIGSSAMQFFDGLVVETIDQTTILLDWTSCCQDMALKGYIIRCKKMNNSSCNEIFVPPGITSYTITGLEPNTEYKLCIDAVDQCSQVICSSGNMTQTTDPLFKERRRHAVPYIAVLMAICLLIAAAVVPLLFLLKYV